MKQRERQWWVGAYALTATLSKFSENEAQGFYETLQALPQLGGLELPVHRFDKIDDPWRHLHLLPRDLDYIITPLPYVMQSLEEQPVFGLASSDPAGRMAALQFMEDLRGRIRRLEDHCGRPAVRAVELHSAPSGRASATMLRQSLEDVLQKDWGPVELWIEHCDALIPGQKPAKGFLDIEAEIAMARDLHLGMNINWGRSVLETRRPEGALEHITRADAAGVLRGLFLSSVAVDDPIYGAWLDNHAPMQGLGTGDWGPRSSLLTGEHARTALTLAQNAQVFGIKIQAAPASLSLTERMQCLREHLEYLSALPLSIGTTEV